MDNVLGAIYLFLVGMLCGWVFAHSEVATECEKLNSFYVGNTVFHCGVKE